jgi:hypothetical protein
VRHLADDAARRGHFTPTVEVDAASANARNNLVSLTIDSTQT